MEKAKKIKLIKRILAVVMFLVIITASFFCGFFVNKCSGDKDYVAIKEVMGYLKSYGVFDTETLEIKNPSAEEISKIVIENLNDDYAKYYTKEEYEYSISQYYGNYYGLGLSCYVNLEVAKVVINSPCYHAGIKEGDIIYAGTYNGVQKIFSSYADLIIFINGVNYGDTFALTINHNGELQIKSMVIKEYEATYVLYADSEKGMAFLSTEKSSKPTFTETIDSMPTLNSDTAYISLSLFETQCVEELKQALNFMKERGRTKLIFDIRNNGGGYMDVLCNVASYLVDTSKNNTNAVAYAKDNKNNYTKFSINGNNFNSNVKNIAVIANENTASASECLIGAMLYYKTCFTIDNLVIENGALSSGYASTYGKGIMQTTFSLSNGGALKLTTAVIYQPDKTTCIHNVGIVVGGENALIKSQNMAITRAQAILAK